MTVIRHGGTGDLEAVAAIQYCCPEAAQWDPGDYMAHEFWVAAADGTVAGFLVLRRVAAILNARARKIDIVARYGGEEFAIVLESTDKAGARQLAERIRVEVSQQNFPTGKGGTFGATLSLGVASYPEDARAKDEIIALADQSLYAAKHGGRNRTVCFSEIEKAKLKAAKA